ncbi:activating signal cointegrator 1 isoform X1 [Petromyzon marinus]|uniref:Activating signal cointegrator 1 n=1 Tax=Petromyzon marinus TaxID=7757 RepID=A0AAJ7SVZ3_PETMA|nr:activating signal cointegrator 1 isoform X1 [Petromyzon marinus]
MDAALTQFCQEQLLNEFGIETGTEDLRYILSIEKDEELEEYLQDLLCGDAEKKRRFIRAVLARRRPSRPDPSGVATVATVYRKSDEVQEQPPGREQQKKGKKKGRNKVELHSLVPEEVTPESQVKTPADLAKLQQQQQEEAAATAGKKKSAKFVSLYTKAGEDRLTVRLPGRHPCDCLAQKHGLVNNCLSCGRIVCEQEASGPCLFCGNLVCTKEEQEVLSRKSNKSDKLLKKLMTDHGRELLPGEEARCREGLEQAQQHRDKLLEYDKNSVRRTQVIDDESDYFATDSNQWLSAEEREKLRRREEELREARHASRTQLKVTFDFAGRRITEDDSPVNVYDREDAVVQEVSHGRAGRPKGQVGAPRDDPPLGELVNPNICQPAPVWVQEDERGGRDGGKARRKDPVAAGGGRAPGTQADPERSRIRIQDRELMEMSDSGMCLSMHQPWASLLVKGIKKSEGRTWYTSHRGRLWIAAGSKQPTSQEVAEVEETHRTLKHGERVEFPADYPTACLLGCVDVIDCLPQEQYREQFPEGESGSPFVFVCERPQELLVKVPIKGRHKIWKLETHVHQGAQKGLMRQMQRDY